MEQVATQIGIIQTGKLIFQGSPETLHAHLNESVVVCVDQPEKAWQTLVKAGWTVQRNGSQRFRVQANGKSDAAMINALLLQAGVNVYQVGLEKPSLEDIFLNLTGDVATRQYLSR